MRVNTPQINHQTIDGEVVVINLENGCYYSLLDLSAVIWQMAGSGINRTTILSQVAAAYPEAADAADLAGSLFDELVADRLIVEGEPSLPSSLMALPPTYTVPRIEKFTDMQELLMLDPIHEVDSIGWPHKPADS